MTASKKQPPQTGTLLKIQQRFREIPLYREPSDTRMDSSHYPIIDYFLIERGFPILETEQTFYISTPIRKLIDDNIFEFPNSNLLSQINGTNGIFSLYLYKDDEIECLVGISVGNQYDYDDVFNPSRFTVTYYGTPIIPPLIVSHLTSHGASPNKLYKENEVSINFAFPSAHGDINTQSQEFTVGGFETIRNNYIPTVQTQVDELLEMLQTTTNGLVVINGPTGTGKTHLIRAILSDVRQQKRGIICFPASTFLQQPNFIHQAISNREFENKILRPIIILEDMGEIFSTTAKVEYMEQFSNLINLTDGLLSVFSSAIYILTFNYESAQIDPAILRPGRCISNIYIPRLPKEQALSLIPNAANKNIPSQNDYSLAEVYAYRLGKTTLPKKAKAPLGFTNIKRDSDD